MADCARPLVIWHANIGNHAGAVDGVAVMAARLASSQAALGHQVTFLATPAAAEIEQQRALLAPAVEEIIAPSSARVLRTALVLMRRPATRPDVLHCHSVYRPGHVILFLFATVLGITTVQSPHSGLAPARFEVQRVRKEVYGYLAERWIHRRANLVHALQEVEREDVIRYSRRRRPVVVVANSVDRDLMEEPRWDAAMTETEPRVALLLARFDVHQKGLDVLAELARRVPEMEFRVHGSQDKNQPEVTERLRRDAPPNLLLLEPIHGAAKFDALRGASLFVMPSRVEGLSLALLEAMALGVPCAVSSYVDRSLKMSEEGIGLGLTGDVDMDAQQLRDVVADPGRLGSLGVAASEWVRRHCAPEQVARAMVDAYTDCTP